MTTGQSTSPQSKNSRLFDDDTRQRRSRALSRSSGWHRNLEQLGRAPRPFASGLGGELRGYSIPLVVSDAGGGEIVTDCFIGFDGFRGVVDGDEVRPPNPEDMIVLMRSDERVAAYEDAMLKALSGETVTIGETPEGWPIADANT